jgi:hypothetical protein
LAGPVAASPSNWPEKAQSRARQLVPPPSTPSNKTCVFTLMPPEVRKSDVVLHLSEIRTNYGQISLTLRRVSIFAGH